MKNDKTIEIVEETETTEEKKSLVSRGVGFVKRHSKAFLIGAGTLIGTAVAGVALTMLSADDDCDDEEIEVDSEIEEEIPFEADDAE